MVTFSMTKTNLFIGSRTIANDCTEMTNSIIKKEIGDGAYTNKSFPDELEIKHYRFKNSIWNTLFNAKEFEEFNDNDYFRHLEIYKNALESPTVLLSQNPQTLEQKLALVEAIQLKFTHFHNAPTLQNEIQQLTVYQAKKVQKLMKNFDLANPLTRASLETFSSDLFILLKGPPINIMENFTKNKTVRINQRMMRILEEDLLLYGLNGIIQRIPVEENISQLQNAKLLVKKIMKYKTWRLLVVPYDLPWVDQIKISDQLLEKILLDGLDNHKSELIAELKKQNLIDQYEHIRKVYRPVAFGVGFYYYYEKEHKKIIEETEAANAENEKANEAAKKKFLDDFKKLADSINAGDTKEKTIDELKEIQFQRVKKSFVNRYHEEPTPDELKEMKQKIFGTN